MVNRAASLTLIVFAWLGSMHRDASAQPGDAIPPGYVKLAKGLSNRYIEDAPLNRSLSPQDRDQLKYQVPVHLELFALIKECESFKHPAVQEALKHLKAGEAQVDALQRAAQDQTDLNAAALNEVYDKALRGEYKREESRTVVRRDADGAARIDYENQTVDDALPAMVFSTALTQLRQGAIVRHTRDTTRSLMESARINAWESLAVHLGSIYPTDAELKNSIDLKYRVSDQADGALVALLSHSGRRKLTQVTLKLEFVHLTTNPGPMHIRYYYFPEFPPDTVFQLPSDIWHNARNSNPSNTRSPNAPQPPSDSPLSGLDGVVKCRIRGWTKQGVIPEETIIFPKHAAQAARWNLAHIYEAVVSQKKQSGGNALKAVRSLPDRWATKEAELITEDLGARSELVPLAKLVSSDPEAFLNAWPKYMDDKAKESFTVSKVFKGEWQFQGGLFNGLRWSADQEKPDPVEGQYGKFELEIKQIEASGVCHCELRDPAMKYPSRMLKGSTRMSDDGAIHVVLSDQNPKPASEFTNRKPTLEELRRMRDTTPNRSTRNDPRSSYDASHAARFFKSSQDIDLRSDGTRWIGQMAISSLQPDGKSTYHFVLSMQ